MKTCIVNTKGFRNPAMPFSAAVVAEGKFVFVAGQGPLRPDNLAIVRGTLEEQFDLTMQNIKAHLEAAGSSIDKIVSMRVFLSSNDTDNWTRMTAAYKKWFPDPNKWPARTTIGCQLLGIDVEIDCIAVAD